MRRKKIPKKTKDDMKEEVLWQFIRLVDEFLEKSKGTSELVWIANRAGQSISGQECTGISSR